MIVTVRCQVLVSNNIFFYSTYFRSSFALKTLSIIRLHSGFDAMGNSGGIVPYDKARFQLFITMPTAFLRHALCSYY